MHQLLFIVLPARIIQFLIAVLVMKVATHFLSPSEMGRLSLYVSVTAFFTVLFIYPVGTFINRRVITWNKTGVITDYFNYYWKYLASVSLIVALLLFVNEYTHIINLNATIPWLLILVCGTIVFNTLNQTLISILNILNHRNWFLGLSITTLIIGFIASYLLVKLNPNSEYWFLGQMIGQGACALIAWKVFYSMISNKKSQSHLSANHINALFTFSWPVSLSVLLNWIQTQGYRFLIEDSLGLSALGFFFAGYAVSAGLIGAVESVMATYFQPIFYKKISSENDEDISNAWNEYAQILLPTLVLAAFFIFIFAKELTMILLSAKFSSAYKFIMWGAISELLRAVTGIFSLITHAKMNTKLLLWPHSIGALIAILLSYVLIPSLGSVGVAISLVLAGVGTLLTVFLCTKSHIKLSISSHRLTTVSIFGCIMLLVKTLIIGNDQHNILWLIIGCLFFCLVQLLLLKPYFKSHT